MNTSLLCSKSRLGCSLLGHECCSAGSLGYLNSCQSCFLQNSQELVILSAAGHDLISQVLSQVARHLARYLLDLDDSIIKSYKTTFVYNSQYPSLPKQTGKICNVPKSPELEPHPWDLFQRQNSIIYSEMNLVGFQLVRRLIELETDSFEPVQPTTINSFGMRQVDSIIHIKRHELDMIKKIK